MEKSEIYKKLGSFIRVENMTGRTGDAVKNQFILKYENGEVFQSYESIIAVNIWNDNKYYIGKHWDYSTTTGKYRSEFLKCDKKELQKMLKNGRAVLVEDF